MKKILSFLFVSIFCLSIVGCKSTIDQESIINSRLPIDLDSAITCAINECPSYLVKQEDVCYYNIEYNEKEDTFYINVYVNENISGTLKDRTKAMNSPLYYSKPWFVFPLSLKHEIGKQLDELNIQNETVYIRLYDENNEVFYIDNVY